MGILDNNNNNKQNDQNNHHRKYTPDEEHKLAIRFLNKAEKLIDSVNESYIVTHRDHKPRELPHFYMDEITLGKELGYGGFGVVYEINEFHKMNNITSPKNEDELNNSKISSNAVAFETQTQAMQLNDTEEQPTIVPLHNNSNININENNNNDKNNSNNDDDNNNNNDNINTNKNINNNQNNNIINVIKDGIKDGIHDGIQNCNDLLNHVKEDLHIVGNQKTTTTNKSYEMTNSLDSHIFCNLIHNDYNDHIHYDNVDHAKKWMRKRPNRNDGQYSRYAFKRLKDNLSELEIARGMVDLAIEAKFLSIVFHPNIIKIRGIAHGNIIDKDFFIIMDRLYVTLDQQIMTWSNLETKYHGKYMGFIGRNKNGLNDLMIERMTVLYDLASVFNYLHENRLVYRDIKPENIGFDFRHDVKLFDFGLCKNLSVKLKANNLQYGYKLTGRVGSFPYMAPEVVQMKTYDTKCDVFSFAILLWEILSLKQAFQDLDANTFVDKVIVQQERLDINRKWPSLTRLVLPEAWDDNPQKRPDMKRISMLIRGDLNLMTSDETILRRTKHLHARSEHSESDDSDIVEAKA